LTAVKPGAPSVDLDSRPDEGAAMSTTTPWSILRSALAWPVASQQQARRNALVASTALAQRRHERLEVERFLEEHARRTSAPVPVGRVAQA
jgi:hypothetical protein